MSLKLGSTSIDKIHLGSTEIKKAYLGSTVVFDNTAVPLYNGVSVMYTLRTPSMSVLWTNAILKIRRDSDNATAFVFGGSTIDSTITLSTFIDLSSDTSPSATTLGTWLGSNSGFVERWYGMTDNNTISTGKRLIQTTTSLQPIFANSSGVIETKNGKPDVDFIVTNAELVGSSNSDLASGKDWSLFTVSYNNNSNSNGTIFNTTTIAGGFSTFNDRRSNKQMCFIDGTTNALLLLISQQNSANQRLLTTIIEASRDITAFYNQTQQDTDSYTGTYNNDAVLIGTRFGATNRLNGGIQEIVIFPNNSVSRTTIETDMDTYYSIP